MRQRLLNSKRVSISILIESSKRILLEMQEVLLTTYLKSKSYPMKAFSVWPFNNINDNADGMVVITIIITLIIIMIIIKTTIMIIIIIIIILISLAKVGSISGGDHRKNHTFNAMVLIVLNEWVNGCCIKSSWRIPGWKWQILPVITLSKEPGDL